MHFPFSSFTLSPVSDPMGVCFYYCPSLLLLLLLLFGRRQVTQKGPKKRATPMNYLGDDELCAALSISLRASARSRARAVRTEHAPSPHNHLLRLHRQTPSEETGPHRGATGSCHPHRICDLFSLHFLARALSRLPSFSFALRWATEMATGLLAANMTENSEGLSA